MKYINSGQKKEELQVLRAIAFLGIFLSHARVSVSWAKLGVSIFFVLSGCLMTCNYYDKELKCSIKDNLQFSINKIKKLYVLHIVTMVCAILLVQRP